MGGGPTGIELSGELRDFLEVRLPSTSCHLTSYLTNFKEDLKSWYPELASRIRITLVEALPSVLPSFSKELITYTERTFKESDIDILTKTMVKKVNEKSVLLKGPDGVEREVPCGMVVWAAVGFVLLQYFRVFTRLHAGQHCPPNKSGPDGKTP